MMQGVRAELGHLLPRTPLLQRGASGVVTWWEEVSGACWGKLSLRILWGPQTQTSTRQLDLRRLGQRESAGLEGGLGALGV